MISYLRPLGPARRFPARPSPALLTALLAAALLAGPAGTGCVRAGDAFAADAGAPAPVKGSGPYNLTIFHTNDAHGAFLPELTGRAPQQTLAGGVVALAWHLTRERETAPASLLLDGGDFMTGNPICDLAVDGVYGGGWQDIRNLLGYDASAVGNHEFDRGRENLGGLERRATFPFLAADILDEQGRPLLPDEPLVLERGGLRVGVMGVSCRELFNVTADTRTAGLSLRDQETVARELIARLDPVTDLLVLISHSGFEADEALARRLAGSGLDVIVGAHSHTRLSEPRLEGGILIVQAGARLKQLGRLDLRVADDRVAGYEGRLVQLSMPPDAAVPDEAGAAAGVSPPPGPAVSPELLALVETYRRKVDAEFGRVIGTLRVDWKRDSGEESNIGNWICDALRARAGADVAFLNSGSIRKDLPAGPIRLMDVREILPFENTLVTFDLTGEQIRRICEQNARNAGGGEHGIAQVSGLSYGWRRVGDHVEVEDVRVGGQPVAADKVYKAAAADYVVMKAEQIFGLPPLPTRYAGVGVTDAVVEAIERAGTVESRVEGRIRELTGR